MVHGLVLRRLESFTNCGDEFLFHCPVVNLLTQVELIFEPGIVWSSFFIYITFDPF